MLRVVKNVSSNWNHGAEEALGLRVRANHDASLIHIFDTPARCGAPKARACILGEGKGGTGWQNRPDRGGNDAQQKLFRDLVGAHGYQTSGTSNGIEALDLAASCAPIWC